MQDKSKVKRLLAILLSAIVLIATAIPSFAGFDYSLQSPGWSSVGSGATSGNKWGGALPQFLRISLYWVPYVGVGTEGADEAGYDWSEGQVVQVGDTFDWAKNDGKNPDIAIVRHTNFKNALEYYWKGYNATLTDDRDGFSDRTYTSPYGGGAWGNVFGYSGSLAFPCPVGNQGGTNIKEFFKNDSVLNMVVSMLAETPSGKKQMNAKWGTYFAQDINNIKTGAYKDEYGQIRYGRYLFIIEPGAYVTLNGVGTAL